MTELLYIFCIAFLFSFIGSIPPGSINLSIMQLSLDGNKMAAYRFALAAALVEYPYAYVAVKFEQYISSALWFEENFHILAAIVMLSLGVIGLWQSRKPVEKLSRFHKSGFRKGVLISLLNPLAIPFWIGVTAYLKAEGLVALPDETSIHLYVAGVSSGTFILLVVVGYFSSKLGESFSSNQLIRKVPAFVFLLLGAYSIVKLVMG